MNRQGKIVPQIKKLVEFFASRCADRQTLDALSGIVSDRGRWKDSKRLFEGIRQKTLKAERNRSHLLSAQYLFEEVCAKTLYNLTNPLGPFDADSPYWIVPNAMELAKFLKIDEQQIIDIVTDMDAGDV